MITLQRKLIGGALVVTAACLACAFATQAQVITPTTTPRATAAAAPSASPAATPAAATSNSAPMDAERAAIWNSPNMLRARAWLQEYCQTSAKVKPGEGEKYMNELQNMSATQMKLWLMKFDEEEERNKQQRAFYQQAQKNALKQAQSADRATQKSYAAIESEETGAANEAQAQIDEQKENEQLNQDDKQLGPYTPYGQGMYPGEGGVHYHFHLYPY